MSTWTEEKHEWAQFLAGRRTHPGEDTKVLLADALDEIKRLHALTTITDSMVEAALNGWFHDEPDGIYEGFPDDTRERMRAALEAALPGPPKENES